MNNQEKNPNLRVSDTTPTTPPPQQNNVNAPYMAMPPPYFPQEDEINLLDLWQVIVAKKKLILGITVTITLLSVIIVLLMTRIYQATAYFLPPKATDLEELIIPGVNESSNISKAYNTFITNLKSRALRREFLMNKICFRS